MPWRPSLHINDRIRVISGPYAGRTGSIWMDGWTLTDSRTMERSELYSVTLEGGGENVEVRRDEAEMACESTGTQPRDDELAMGGRFTLASDDMERLARRFAFSETRITWKPRWNIAPTDEVLTVVATPDGKRRAGGLAWGLKPHWQAEKGKPLINAKAETVDTLPAFKESFERRRCLILADGFYEWRRKDQYERTPFHFRLASGEPFAFAGLWATHTVQGTGKRESTCTIITTTPNPLVSPIHDRMPVILSEEAERIWLDPRQSPATLKAVLKPFPAGSMRAFEVQHDVNSVRNEGPDLVRPLTHAHARERS